jgi:prophage antirepressor-like protein
MVGNGDPWWVASDICIVLGLSNLTEELKALDRNEKSTLRVSEGGPEQKIINELSLYLLLARSNKKRTKKFQRWVFHDFLPKIMI